MSDPATVAESMIGVKFRHQGRTSWNIDCVGLLVRAFAPKVRDVADYPPRGSRRLLEEIKAQFREVSGPKRGRVVLLTRVGSDCPRHVGICVSEERMVHADAVVGMVCSAPIENDRYIAHSYWELA